MSKRVLDSPEIEAKDLFYRNRDNDLFENFFEDASPPDGVSKDDYLKELKIEYYNLKIEEARRTLGLKKELIYYYYEFPDGQVFEGRIKYGTLDQRDSVYRSTKNNPVYNHLKRFPDIKPKILTKDTHYKTNKIFYLYDKEKN